MGVARDRGRGEEGGVGERREEGDWGREEEKGCANPQPLPAIRRLRCLPPPISAPSLSPCPRPRPRPPP